MKKLLMFLMGLILMCLAFGMVLVGGAIYDTASKQTIDTFFFQTADISSRRIGAPVSAHDLNSDKIREMLVDKFITEYFYVVPDTKNIDARLAGKSGKKGLYFMVSDDVFNNWVNTEGKKISELATKRYMRTARLVNMELPENSDNWWTITYELTTWPVPNDLTHEPEITQNVMYINMRYEPGFRPTLLNDKMDIGDFLENGGDPSFLFKFMVEAVEQGNS